MKRFREWGRFGLVGGIAFVVDVTSFNVLRQLVELGPLTSKALAVVLATSVAYLLNARWTFAHRGARRDEIGRAGEYLVFCALNGVGMAIALSCLAVSYYLFGLTSALAQNVSANGVGLVLGMVFRFWAYRRWVFPEPVPAPVHPPRRSEAPWAREEAA